VACHRLIVNNQLYMHLSAVVEMLMQKPDNLKLRNLVRLNI